MEEHPDPAADSTLELDSVELSQSGALLNAAYFGQRIALIGNWDWLYRHLAGFETIAGRVNILGVPGRDAVQQGKVGVALDPATLPADFDPLTTLALNLQLCGHPRASARSRALSLLTDWGLRFLDGRKLGSLNPSEHFALQAVLAVSTNPRVLFLGPPTLRPETRNFEWQLLHRLAASHHLAIACHLDTHLELLPFCDEIAQLDSEGARPAVSPRTLWESEQRYRVKALRHGAELATALTDRGFDIDNSFGDAQLVIRIPEPDSTSLLFQIALEVDAPILELVPFTPFGN